MIKVGEETLKESLSLVSRDKALMALERIHRTALSSGLSKMTAREIESEIKAARRAV